MLQEDVEGLTCSYYPSDLALLQLLGSQQIINSQGVFLLWLLLVSQFSFPSSIPHRRKAQ